MQLTFGFEKSGDEAWTMNQGPRLLTVQEAAASLTRLTGRVVDDQRVYYLTRMGRLVALRIGRFIRVWMDS